jgi:long-chain acyl-CoA synthetase
MTKVWHRYYDKGVPKSIEYPKIPLRDLFNQRAEENPDNPYLIMNDTMLPYKICNSMARSFANGLLAIGVTKGDRVAIVAPNVPQWVIARQACYKIGAIAVPINPLSAVREMEHYMKDSGTETAVAMAAFAGKLIQVKKVGSTPLKRIIAFQIQGSPVELENADYLLDFDTMISSHPNTEPDIEVEADDIAVLQYTGGTTGISKGCALSNFNLVAMAISSSHWLNIVVSGNQTKTLAAIPLYHVYGFNFNVNLNMINGGSVVLVPQPSPDNLLKAINQHQPNVFPAVPTMLIGINQHPGTPDSKVNSIKAVISGGAPLASEAMKTFEDLSGTRIMEGYGLSEISAGITFNPIVSRKVGSIGVPMPDVDIRVVDIDTGTKDMPAGEPGELIAQTPTLMTGYWNNPDETKHAIRDGWLYTGDIGFMDEDGFISIVDRKKDMILAGGFNVYPRDIDEVMYTHPKVLHSCTLGVPDPKRGETVKVFIQTRPGQTLTEQEVIDYCKERLTPYKVPKIVEFIDELPLTSVGKADRNVLRNREQDDR